MNSWGLLTSIDVYNCNPETIRNPEEIKRYIVELCELIDMKRFGEPTIVKFGEEEKVAGYSMVQLIMTSCISGHFADATNAAYIDVFSCKDYDPKKVKAFTKSFFGGKKAKMKTLVRE